MPDLDVCPEVLEIAIDKLARIGGPSVPLSLDHWTILRSERRRATLYRLHHSTSRTTLFYKVLATSDDEGALDADSLSRRLRRTESLTDQLLDETAGKSVSPAPVLAADTHRRIVVTLGVEGHEIRARRLRWLIPGQTLSPTQAGLIGEGCALIERCSDGREVTFDWERFFQQVEYRLARARTDRRTTNRLHLQLERAASDHLAREAPVYVHGDLSPTNILVSGPRVHLIDFSWFSGFRGYDLGLFSYRLRAMNKVLLGWGPRLSTALLSAYKSASGPRYDPLSLKLVDLFLLVRGLGSGWPWMCDLAQGALEGVKTDFWEDDGDFQWWWEAVR